MAVFMLETLNKCRLRRQYRLETTLTSSIKTENKADDFHV